MTEETNTVGRTEKKRLFVLSGPSGTGKGTVCKEVLRQTDHMVLSISATTRRPRAGEVDGKDYFFLTPEAFLSMEEQDELLEYAQFSENFYGTPRKYVESSLEEGNHVLLEIEVQGAMQVKKKMPEAVLIFLYPPSMEELEKRLRERGTDDDASIRRRLERAKEELKMLSAYDYAVENDRVEWATEKICAIIRAEQCRV